MSYRFGEPREIALRLCAIEHEDDQGIPISQLPTLGFIISSPNDRTDRLLCGWLVVSVFDGLVDLDSVGSSLVGSSRYHRIAQHAVSIEIRFRVRPSRCNAAWLPHFESHRIGLDWIGLDS